jgi:ribosomal protein S18 acetylase RimI-like enzyme
MNSDDVSSRVELFPITERGVELLRTLNTAIFPVIYQDKFYQQVVANNCGYTFLAHFDGIVVGTVCCRLEHLSAVKDQKDRGCKLYIMTLGVLAPYRRLKIGSTMLKKILELASKNKNIMEVQLHVQTNNEEAIAFYKNFGFSIIQEVKDYYKKITPPDAFVLSKPLQYDNNSSNTTNSTAVKPPQSNGDRGVSPPPSKTTNHTTNEKPAAADAQ